MPEIATVSFKLFGVARGGRASRWETVVRPIQAGATVGQILPSLGVERESQASILVGGRVVGWDFALQGGEEVIVIPPLVGG